MQTIRRAAYQGVPCRAADTAHRGGESGQVSQWEAAAQNPGARMLVLLFYRYVSRLPVCLYTLFDVVDFYSL